MAHTAPTIPGSTKTKLGSNKATIAHLNLLAIAKRPKRAVKAHMQGPEILRPAKPASPYVRVSSKDHQHQDPSNGAQEQHSLGAKETMATASTRIFNSAAAKLVATVPDDQQPARQNDGRHASKGKSAPTAVKKKGGGPTVLETMIGKVQARKNDRQRRKLKLDKWALFHQEQARLAANGLSQPKDGQKVRAPDGRASRRARKHARDTAIFNNIEPSAGSYCMVKSCHRAASPGAATLIERGSIVIQSPEGGPTIKGQEGSIQFITKTYFRHWDCLSTAAMAHHYTDGRVNLRWHNLTELQIDKIRAQVTEAHATLHAPGSPPSNILPENFLHLDARTLRRLARASDSNKQLINAEKNRLRTEGQLSLEAHSLKVESSSIGQLSAFSRQFSTIQEALAVAREVRNNAPPALTLQEAQVALQKNMMLEHYSKHVVITGTAIAAAASPSFSTLFISQGGEGTRSLLDQADIVLALAKDLDTLVDFQQTAAADMQA